MKVRSILVRLYRQLIKVSFFRFVVKYFIVWNILQKNNKAKKNQTLETPWVCSLPGFDPAQHLKYIEEVFADYFTYSGLEGSAIQEKRILEVGTGDSLGVALKFIASGAKQVVCVDRFSSLRNGKEQCAIYKSLRESLTFDQRRRFDLAVKIWSDNFEINQSKVEYFKNTSIETLNAFQVPGSFDFIFSRAVLEHVYDLDIAMQVMDELLIPGGYMIHEIDFRDHGIFTHYGLHPLTFLTISDNIWKKMSSHNGAPNRKLIGYFRKKLQNYKSEFTNILAVGSDVKFHKKNIVLNIDYNQEQLSSVIRIKPKLSHEFKTLQTEDLLISGIFVAAKKQ